jgi:signal transduction histidine kinase
VQDSTDLQAAGYVHRLAEVASAAAGATAPEQVVEAVLGAAIAALGATAGAVVRLDGSGALRLAGASGGADPAVDAWRHRPRDPAGAAAPDPLATVARSGASSWAPPGAAGLAVVPLLRSGTPTGTLGLTFSRTPRPLPAAQDFLIALAQLCALGLERLELSARLAAEVRGREDFLAVASHELRTPVTSLRGFAQLLLRQLRRHGAVDPERLTAALSRIEEQSGRLARLVGQLLDVSGMDGRGLRLERRRVDVAGLVRRTAADVQADAGRHHITVHAPPHVEARVDPARFEHVLLSLLSHAVRASVEGGEVEVELTPPHDGDQLQLTVTDHGPDVPVEAQERLFDRYAARAQEGGQVGWMGLWLDVSRQIVELHGGTLVAEFPAGGGTRLTVSLPSEEPAGGQLGGSELDR